MIFGVLDQSPIRSGGTPAEAIQETLVLAEHADRLGYARYWLAEHHSSGGFAGAAPEVLMGLLAARTSRIRVGSGGVMLHDELPDGHPYRGVRAMPAGPTAPPIWILGSSSDRGGARRALRHRVLLRALHQRGGRGGRHALRPGELPSLRTSRRAPGKRGGVRALRGHGSRGGAARTVPRPLHRAALHGPLRAVPFRGRGEAYEYSPPERAIVAEARRRTVAGTPEQVKVRLEALAGEYGVDELVNVTITHDFKARLCSYELLAEAFGLG